MLKKIALKESLSVRLIFYFALIGVVIILMAIELYFLVDTSKIAEKIFRFSFFTEGLSSKTIPESYLFYLRNKVFLLLGVFAFMIAVIMIMFAKNLVGPLQYITVKSEEILDGDLSTTIVMDSADELGKVAECINDLTSNIQEIITNVNMHRNTIAESVAEISETIKLIKDNMPDNHDVVETLQSNLESIHGSLEELKEMGNLFTLYQIDQIEELDNKELSDNA